ncbi:MAG TPA: hypothetical protein VIR04_11075 [Paralcaligenes sp.]|jgi:hypothetical protein
MSTSSYAEASLLTKTPDHTAIHAVISGAMSVLKAAYATARRILTAFLDFAVEVQELQDATFKTLPYIAHK